MSLAQEPTKADKATKAVKELCLTGTQYDLKADAQGNLTLLKLAPGATGSVSVNVRSSSGAAAIFDDKLRKEADEDIRNCIKPYIQKIIDAILQDDSAEQPSSGKPIVQPTLLIEIIKNQQVYNVKESYGEAAGQNFSERDFNEFVRQGRDRAIAEKLKNDNDFRAALLAIKHMNPTDRQHLFSEGVKTYRKTWAQIGRIDQEGQTEAGQEADKMIAKAIVELATDLLLLSDDEIRKLSEPTPNSELVGQWLYRLKDNKTGMDVYGTFDISNVDSTLTAAGDSWYVGTSPSMETRRGHWTTKPMCIDNKEKKIYMLYDMVIWRPNCDEKKAGEANYKGFMMLDHKGELSPPALGGKIIRIYSQIERDFSINAVADVNAKKNNMPIQFKEFPDKFKALLDVNIRRGAGDPVCE